MKILLTIIKFVLNLDSDLDKLINQKTKKINQFYNNKNIILIVYQKNQKMQIFIEMK